ncbi:10569_t:CDS:2, partial [Acaulospora morrowiae]
RDVNIGVPKFRQVNGRKYHNIENSKYPFPSDDEELDRQHLQHFLLRYLWEGNFSAPVEHILNNEYSKVLDVGCGAGTWALEIATNYQIIEIIGMDISP